MKVNPTKLAALLLPIVQPARVGTAALEHGVVSFSLKAGVVEVTLQEIESVEVDAGRLWSGVRIHTASGTTVVSGLASREAQAFADAVEGARAGWWRTTLRDRGEAIRAAHEKIEHMADPPRYLARSIFSELERQITAAVADLPARWPDALSSMDEIRTLSAIRVFLRDPESRRTQANAAFVQAELVRSKEFFDIVETKPLAREQRNAVVIDEDRNLIVAAAGSGKTSVIVAKAGWLLQKGYRRPGELLLLAFARDARTEMKERLKRRLGEDISSGIQVNTFHELGSAIIGKVEGPKPTLAKVAEDERALCDLLKNIIGELLADPTFSQVMVTWFQSHFATYESAMAFENWGQYWDYIRANEIRSLNGERVKSFEECEIANFLYLNGIPYKYEQPYEYPTATPDKKQYQPDFYLPEARIYIEHFAINASGDTPPFINREEYVQSMEWKRRLHTERGTVMIETFSHEKAAGNLAESLAPKLAAHGVKFSPIPSSEIFEVLEKQGRVDPFTRLVATFLHHFKGAQLTDATVSERAAAVRDGARAQAFLTLFRRIFERYQAHLADEQQIDFHDMIIKATEHVERGRYQSPFGYILVDEFQDISRGRARLLKALLDQSEGSQLFAVGDDWQAIYRFAGSDIAIMRGFQEMFGASERADLGTTFRCSDRIAAVATEFVLQNPAQIRKEVSAVVQADRPCVHVGLPSDECPDLLRGALRRVATDAARRAGDADVLLLGRYRHSCPKNLADLKQEHPNLRISFMTVHGSKGLEADYVVVLGLISGRYGFPAERTDDPILDLVLATPEAHPNAEERRLLYVALTRAKCHVYLLADGGPPSQFVTELVGNGYDVTTFGRALQKEVPCPKCVKGQLLPKLGGKGGMFYGCSNFPFCDHTQPACHHCGAGTPVKVAEGWACGACDEEIEGCLQCGGWLHPKKGKFGPFLGCVNFPICTHTKNLLT
ncbi:helicase IV [Vineibacter terrae]|uniref:DNA 3'-5' helicase n=1 Tax=Vineibacter terrae TaxID=2586908 RepID=A0A5C8PAY9_9HYPH|nr:UvrD-helicase domain-containing protein [Vineibacter terrae]TXL70850.1 helicase IV [Vineibacter terrae]